MKSFVTVKHRAYREFIKGRAAANDAGQAIVLAMRVLSADMQKLPADEKFLPDYYPAIHEIERLNVTPQRALAILANAESYYASMSIPFYVAILNTYVVESAKILKKDGKLGRGNLEEQSFGKLLGRLRNEAGVVWSADEEALLRLVCLVRNRIIHYGGIVGNALVSHWRLAPASAKNRWRRAAGRGFTLVAGEQLLLGTPEVQATLAVTHAIARATNRELVRLVSSGSWSRMVVEDWQEEASGNVQDHAAALRKLVTFNRAYYADLGLSKDDLDEALISVT